VVLTLPGRSGVVKGMSREIDLPVGDYWRQERIINAKTVADLS
jgi:hypothetical protein